MTTPDEHLTDCLHLLDMTMMIMMLIDDCWGFDYAAFWTFLDDDDDDDEQVVLLNVVVDG